MSSSDYTEKMKEPPVTERCVASDASLSTEDNKHLEAPFSDPIRVDSQVPPPYHVFTRSRKLQMVCIVSLAAIFSPLSSNVYFPALGAISKVSSLGKSMSSKEYVVLTLLDRTWASRCP